jgi:hypothetical protein
VLLVVRERHAREPIVSIGLFRNTVVRVSTMFAFLYAFGTVGATIIVFNQYAQVVLNFAPSDVWALLLPFALMSLLTGLVVGRLIAARGRYKIFPMVGALVGIAGMTTFSRLDGGSASWMFGLATGILGTALGLSQQVPVIATQNAVDRDELGTATGTLQFCQQLGIAVGAAVFGSMYATRLLEHADRLEQLGIPRAQFLAGREAVHALPGVGETRAVDAYADAISGGYRYAIVLVALAFVVACFLPERPLQEYSFAGRAAAHDADEDDDVPA